MFSAGGDGAPDRGMNTTLHAALLLPLVAGALCAQDLQLETSLTTSAISAHVDGAKEGALVVLVLGLHEAAYKLPGDQILGVEPDMVIGIAIADSAGTAKVGARLPRGEDKIDCFAQAVAVAVKLPLDAPGGITVSKVQHLRAERI